MRALAALGLVILTASMSGAQTATDVRFPAGSVTLAGTLLLPAGPRAPGVVLIGGSGPATRDGVAIGSAFHAIYKTVAEHLAARGIAVLRYDKRCIGASACSPEPKFDDYIADARAALAYLRSRPEIDPARTAVVGHSEGGLIAAHLARDENPPAGVVLVATAARSLRTLLRDQVRARLTEAGKTTADVEIYLARMDQVLDALAAGRPVDPSDPRLAGDVLLQSLVANRAFVLSLLDVDPVEVAAFAKNPVLILQGDKDIQVDVKDAQALAAAILRAKRGGPTVRLLKNVDHLMKTSPSATVASYADASRPVDPALLEALSTWLGERLKTR